MNTKYLIIAATILLFAATAHAEDMKAAQGVNTSNTLKSDMINTGESSAKGAASKGIASASSAAAEQAGVDAGVTNALTQSATAKADEGISNTADDARAQMGLKTNKKNMEETAK